MVWDLSSSVTLSTTHYHLSRKERRGQRWLIVFSVKKALGHVEDIDIKGALQPRLSISTRLIQRMNYL